MVDFKQKLDVSIDQRLRTDPGHLAPFYSA